MLEVQNIIHKYDEDVILNNLTFTINEAETVAIVGESGCGKTTLLSILGLLKVPTSGTIIYNGKNVSDLSDDEKSKIRNLDFGFIFQNSQLINTLSVLENVLLPARLARRKNTENDAINVLKSLGLEQRMYHLPHQLSLGQRRRVAVARAILLKPKIIFADEPTNDLDFKRAQLLGEYLFDLKKSNTSLVIVTHDMKLADKADRKIVISNTGTINLQSRIGVNI